MVVTVVGDDGGASGGGFGAHGGGGPLVTGEPGLPVIVACAGELGGAAPDTCLAVWVQPAAPATKTTAIAARRAGPNFRTGIEITVLKPGLFVFRAVTAAGRPDSKHNATAPRRAANQLSPSNHLYTERSLTTTAIEACIGHDWALGLVTQFER